MTDIADSKSTPRGKAIRTAQQTFIVIAPVFLGIVLLPEVQAFTQEYMAVLVPFLVPLIAIVTYLHNKFGK